MTYEEWKATSKAASEKATEASNLWNREFPCNGNLLSEKVRFSARYLELKAGYDTAKDELRKINTSISNAWKRKAARERRGR